MHASARRRASVLAALTLLPLLAGCTAPVVASRARAGDLLIVDLLAWDAQGREVRNVTGLHAVNGASVPVHLPPGWDANTTEVLPPGVRAALTGASPGEARDTALLPPEQGYGPWKANRTIQVPEFQQVGRNVTVEPLSVQVEDATPGCTPSGCTRLKILWANQSWDVAPQPGGDGEGTRVRLLSTPPAGTLLELPDYWNDQYHLWRSELVRGDNESLLVHHQAEPGRSVLVGNQAYRITQAKDTVVADGNPPLARETLRFHVVLRDLAFVAGGAFPPAPDAVLVTLDGRTFNVSDLRGKPVLLDFFATWCVTCKKETPVLARLHETYPGIEVVSVTVDPVDNPARVRGFIDEAGRISNATWGRGTDLNWTWAFDPTGQAARGFSVTGLPRGVLLDAEGRIRSTSAGFQDVAEWQSALQAVAGPPQ